MSFEELDPPKYKYVDVNPKNEIDWQKLYIESLEQTMSLAGAFRSILINPERIKMVGDSLDANLQRLQQTMAEHIVSVQIARSKK